MSVKPVLSIGIIFKNEIRCLERCVKSLQPLRDAFPCELVMADTGSDDGSREIAEKYADIFFDFPWINDFAAARNAVMDRCSGEWYFSIDADEWLDEDVRELVAFFTGSGRKRVDACGIMERNYYTYDLGGRYSSFIACRLLRMSTGIRFKGEIHENWSLDGLRNLLLRNTVLHHDGYVETSKGTAAGRAKLERNMELLRKKMEDSPDDLVSYLQFLGSGQYEPDFDERVREAALLAEKKARTGGGAARQLGAAIFYRVVLVGKVKKFPELEEWFRKAEELFPDSYFIRLDAAFQAVSYYLGKKEFERTIHWGEMFLRGWEDFLAGRGDISSQAFNSLQHANPQDEANLKITLLRAYVETGRLDEAEALLRELDYTLLDAQWTGNALKTLHLLHLKGRADLSPIVVKMWEDIQIPKPDEKWAEDRKKSFISAAARFFTPEYLAREANKPGNIPPVYTLYAPLKGKCALGTAAAILGSGSVLEIGELLGLVEKWEELPIAALSRALRLGVQFPLAGSTMSLEEMDRLAVRLAEAPEDLRGILKQTAGEDLAGSWQTLAWARGLAIAAVQAYDWRDESTGLELARTFAKVEQAFITGCYTPEVLREGNLFVLPPMHRFGWYCVQAFDALALGDTVGYVRFLRKGFAVHEGMKAMVEFLTEHTPELQAPPPSPELLELAEKVRAMLAAYPADDPAVAALKASPVYQKVAYLIEGEDA